MIIDVIKSQTMSAASDRLNFDFLEVYVGIIISKYGKNYQIYLLNDFDVDLVELSVAANQRRGFMEKVQVHSCDLLPPKFGQDCGRGRLVNSFPCF